MVIEGFDEICTTIYIAKLLFDMGKYGLVEENFSDVVDFDVYYENMHFLMEKLFVRYESWYYEKHNMEIHVMSDPVIADFYILAGEYGKKHKIPEENNPYFQEAQRQAQRHFNFSYCLDWKLIGHSKPKRPLQSRLAVLIYLDDWVDYGYLAYGLIEIYEWFKDACIRLRDLLYGNQTGSIHLPREEADAA